METKKKYKGKKPADNSGESYIPQINTPNSFNVLQSPQEQSEIPFIAALLSIVETSRLIHEALSKIK